MKQTARYPKTRSYFKIRRHPVKLTALLYLKEAVIAEQYESCAGFIRIAREFGANAQEIQSILEDFRRAPTG